ncbi:hypothetical protein MCOR27_003467 [Pyricularia oryzae]|uniref:Amino acid transporter transmembrane domain-containing protein n=2 Tax=Pyricularia TaxID=48558 RepID=A0ABQ8N814_PYRGI|nr:hypothetical protein MCOR01_005342 [Pyricularia oryzae]KAI6292692.1 hypothetical protein MCOR33_009672 [Pyricularia grisea]KAH9427727.1 hypothetical protein MCOR02_011959 [Pyricularia oryzae]KAI6255588.1 hypothetical protein MCOR19_007936 [Pyricularia oryzae]KAI6282958.1 hypothetical protein MCOR27_003467 [Pyricularia oryzae]
MAEEARRPEDITPPRNNSMASDNAPNPEKDQSEAGNSGVLGELINHKTLTWWQGGIVLIAETVSLGVLSLPSVLATLGLVPGIIMILVMSIISTYSGWVLGEFRREYPHVLNFGDALEVIGTPIGMGRTFQHIFGWSQVFFQVFVMASHILTWTICLLWLTNGKGVCSILLGFVGTLIFIICNLPRTLKQTSWMSMVSCASITAAVVVTAIAVTFTQQTSPWKPGPGMNIDLFRKVEFAPAFLGVTNVAIAFSSHSCFFSVIDEFKKPEDWPKALALLQVADTVLYLFAAIMIYYFVGRDVPSPALSAAPGNVLPRVIWGIAIPTIVIAGVIYGHVASKYIFVRVFRNSAHLERRTKRSSIVWVAIVVGLWTIAWVISESIPVFNGLLGLVAALFVSWFSYGLPGFFWLWMNTGEWFSSPKQMCKFAANAFLLLTGIMICALGLWASVNDIKVSTSGASSPVWKCRSL